MSRATLCLSFPWARYSKKLATRIDTPRWGGHITPEETRGLRLVIGEYGSVASGNATRLYWLVDEADGIIADAKHQTFGQSALIGAAEAACELTVGKNWDQANRIGADFIDKHLRDKPDIPSFPAETSAHLNLVIHALEACAEQCTDIPLPETYSTPIDHDFEVVEGGIPGFLEMHEEEQLRLIRAFVKEEIQPYVELDAGGVEVLKVLNSSEVLIAYEGACTTCHSATGSTLTSIQQLLRAKIHPDLVVVPEL
jgi:NifU-like protein